MRVIVCGSRTWKDADKIRERLAKLPERTLIVHGDALGADNLAASEAALMGLLLEPHPAYWKRHGKRAGIIRNEEMAELGAQLCIAFWDGKSKGTHHMLRAAARRAIPTEIVSP